jgi:hypothetical protein
MMISDHGFSVRDLLPYYVAFLTYQWIIPLITAMRVHA